jgi:hypothetical protein
MGFSFDRIDRLGHSGIGAQHLLDCGQVVPARQIRGHHLDPAVDVAGDPARQLLQALTVPGHQA